MWNRAGSTSQGGSIDGAGTGSWRLREQATAKRAAIQMAQTELRGKLGKISRMDIDAEASR